MVAYRILFLAGAVAALPLNINLGAYSPALVVGDGEISFGGNNDVNGLMSVLQGAAVSAANGAAANAAAAPAREAAPQAPVSAPAAAPAAEPAAAVAVEQNQVQDATLTDQVSVADLEAQQIAALQGMGKAVLPRAEGEEAGANVNKRDLASFDRALKYAESALTKGPKIQLGTPAAGVGILIDNNPTASGAITPAEKKKRDLPGNSRVKVTTMYVRSGIPASLQNSNTMSARSVEGEAVEPRYETIQIAPAKRDANPDPNTIDAVNLNVAGDQGVTMTFVETIDDEDDDDL